MADEELPTAEVVQEQIDAAEEEAPPAPKTVDDFARERGWKAREEFTGDETKWRPADEWLAFGLDQGDTVKKSLRTVEERLGNLTRTTAQITEAAVDRARKEERQVWESKLSKAVEQGDHGAAFEATSKIAELAQPAPKDPAGDPLVSRFIQDHSWFQADPVARAVAQAESSRLAETGASVSEQLEAAKAIVHKRFPEYAPARAKPAVAVTAPAGRVASLATGKKTFADLPQEAQQVAREMVKRKLVPSTDAYVDHYFGTGETE